MLPPLNFPSEQINHNSVKLGILWFYSLRSKPCPGADLEEVLDENLQNIFMGPSLIVKYEMGSPNPLKPLYKET
jgi:hypothetical protein